MKGALGLVETIGLVTAILVSDTMAKTANVNIIGIENTKGLGYMTVKIYGDVGAVNAAVISGKQIAIENNAFVSAKVIPRPSNTVESVFCQCEKEEINGEKSLNDSIIKSQEDESLEKIEIKIKNSQKDNKDLLNEYPLVKENETYLKDDIVKEDTYKKTENVLISEDNKPTKRTTKKKS